MVETVEEERVRSIVLEAATRLQAPMYEWSISDGLRRRSGTTLEGTKDALSMLQRIDEIHERDSLFSRTWDRTSSTRTCALFPV